jgi:hypothetical protein
MNAVSSSFIKLGVICFAFSRSIEGFSTGDRVSTLIRTHHGGVSYLCLQAKNSDLMTNKISHIIAARFFDGSVQVTLDGFKSASNAEVSESGRCSRANSLAPKIGN